MKKYITELNINIESLLSEAGKNTFIFYIIIHVMEN
jgi:hypothetical protein